MQQKLFANSATDVLTTSTPAAVSLPSAKTKVTFAPVTDTLQRVTLCNATAGSSGTTPRSVHPKVVVPQRTIGRQQQPVEQFYRQQRGTSTVQQTIHHRTNGGPSTVYVKEIKNGYATPGVSVRSSHNASGSFPHTIMVCASNFENKTPSNANSASSSPSSSSLTAAMTSGNNNSWLVNFPPQKSSANSHSVSNSNSVDSSTSKTNKLQQFHVTRNF
uniref:Uncharacterized protein n=1 Tax=Romanomermis culicivorax TaxID=13658 RepID=A0A915KFQ5_ROMCU